jgi:hypothetical protein
VVEAGFRAGATGATEARRPALRLVGGTDLVGWADDLHPAWLVEVRRLWALMHTPPFRGGDRLLHRSRQRLQPPPAAPTLRTRFTAEVSVLAPFTERQRRMLDLALPKLTETLASLSPSDVRRGVPAIMP